MNPSYISIVAVRGPRILRGGHEDIFPKGRNLSQPLQIEYFQSGLGTPHRPVTIPSTHALNQLASRDVYIRSSTCLRRSALCVAPITRSASMASLTWLRSWQKTENAKALTMA